MASPDDQTEPAIPRRSKAWARVAIKSALGLIVIVAVARHASRTWADLNARGESVRIAPGPFALSVVLYLSGLVLFGLYYWRVMAASATPIGRYPAVRAYLISHLGKYVPGKAMVVVMRAGLSTPYGARAATAAFASMYETLLMMGAGGLLTAVAFGWDATVALAVPGLGRTATVPLPMLGLGLGAIFLVVVDPKVFPRLAALARLPFPGVGPDALPTFTRRLQLEGLAWSTLGWISLGLSQVAVLRAILPEGLPGSAWPTAIASVALATVAGFVVPIAPGGLGVREWVLWTALASAIDKDRAVVAALVLRLAWVVGELIAASVLVFVVPRRVAP